MQAQAQEKAKVLILVPVLTLKPFSRRNMRCYLYVCAHGAVKTRQVKNLLKKLHLSKLIALKNDFEEHVLRTWASHHTPFWIVMRITAILLGPRLPFSIPDFINIHHPVFSFRLGPAEPLRYLGIQSAVIFRFMVFRHNTRLNYLVFKNFGIRFKNTYSVSGPFFEGNTECIRLFISLSSLPD